VKVIGGMQMNMVIDLICGSITNGHRRTVWIRTPTVQREKV